ncbi:MAG: DMT family transporter [Candidatus Kapaibacteriales bacterium]
MDQHSKSILFGLCAVVCWSTVAAAFKIALKSVDYLNLLFYTSLFTFLFYSITVFSTKRVKNILQIAKKDFLLSFLMAFLNPFLYYLVLFKSYSLLKAQEALSLNYTWAIILTLLISIFQKKKIRLLSYLSLLISFLGVLVILSKGKILTLQPSNSLGAFLAISSAFIWGCFWLLNSISKIDVITRMFYNFFFGTVFILLFHLLSGSLKFFPLTAFLPILYISFFEMGITFIVWNKALVITKNPAIINNSIYLSPLISIYFINIVLKEKIELSTFIGLILILAGILFQYYFSNFRPKIQKSTL